MSMRKDPEVLNSNGQQIYTFDLKVYAKEQNKQHKTLAEFL